MQHRPAVGRPADGSLDEDAGTFQTCAVAVADEECLARGEVVDGAVAGGLKLLLVALEEEVATALGHGHALAVGIGAVNVLRASYGHAVVALCAPAAVVPADEEVVVVAMVQDEGGLDGVAPGEPRRGVLRSIRIAGAVAAVYT